jgi:LmbE family N-acetylglucosaminyl deacetylase
MSESETLTTDLPRPARALAVGAHPDDVEFGCGATLARWAAEGTELVHVICTDGSKGTWDPTADLAALVARRRVEQVAASRALGGAGVVEFLDRVDGELVDDRPTRSALAELIRRHRPEVLLAHDPWKRYRLHPDHRAAGFLALDAVVAARDPHFFPEHGLAPHRPLVILLFEADEPNHVEVAADRWLAARTDALEAHESQFETTHFHRVGADGDSDRARALAEFRALERRNLVQMGASAGVELGEAFRLIDDV